LRYHAIYTSTHSSKDIFDLCLVSHAVLHRNTNVKGEMKCSLANESSEI
jgi:hypothetical protein